MSKPKNAPKKKTAVQMLKGSRLHPTQLELMGDDVDLQGLYLALNTKDIDIIGAVTDAVVDRTIEGASTVKVTVQDQDKKLLQSGRLSARNDIEIDGLFFRLVGVAKQGPTLTLTFEDREVSILRTYNTPIKQSLSTSRARMTRAKFVLRMLRQVKELPPIPYVIPELNKVQPIADVAQSAFESASRLHDRTLGIAKDNDLTIKQSKMSENQRKVANAVLDVGASMVLPRKLLVMSMMAAIQESTMANLPRGKPGDYNFIDSKDPKGNPVGVFQQIPKWWAGRGGASRNIAADAKAFLTALSTVVQANQSISYQAAIEKVQNSGNASAYANHRTEAERLVTMYGVTDNSAAALNAQWQTDAATGDYEFYRGIPPTSASQKKKGKTDWGKEGSWDAFQRLANEVQWRAFFVSGTFYFIAEDDLFKSQPIATIDEDTPGVLSIDGDYDEGKKSATLTVTCLMGRWPAPPGSVVQVKNMGPWNGRWLVNDVSRSLFNPQGTITLKKPLPRLPEPSGSNVSSQTGQGTWTGTPAPGFMPGEQKQFKVATGLVQPIPTGYHSKIIQGVHETAGLAGYPACDFGADAGSPVIAVENGTIVKLSGHNPKLGPSDPFLGVHGPFGWSLYLKGDSGTEYYYTHLGSRQVTLNQKVLEGQLIGHVGDYAKWGGANHTHVGAHQSGKGPDILQLMNAPQAVSK